MKSSYTNEYKGIVVLFVKLGKVSLVMRVSSSIEHNTCNAFLQSVSTLG